MKTVTFFYDELEVTVPKGSTIMDAARILEQPAIPHLCYSGAEDYGGSGN